MKKRDNFIPFHRPSFDHQEIDAVVDTLKGGWITTGPKTLKFENQFSKFLNNDMSSLAVNSCTAALHLSLLLLKVGIDDEIITTPFTFVATANVVEYVGAKLVLADINNDDLNIDPNEIEKKITSKTKAIIVVHYGGNACRMKEIMHIAKKYNLVIIEDVAHAMGGTYQGHKLGAIGDFSAFSFYANKNMTTSEGGMLCSNDKNIDKARIMSLHGINKNAWKRYRQDGSWYYDVVYPGMKYNMTDIAASIGIIQLKKLEKFNKKRKIIAEKYMHGFKDNEYIELPHVSINNLSSWYNFYIRLYLNKLSINRDEFLINLKEFNIGCSVHFIPIHMHSYYKNKYFYINSDYVNSYNNFLRILCLPIYPDIKDEEVNYIIEVVNNLCKKYAR